MGILVFAFFSTHNRKARQDILGLKQLKFLSFSVLAMSKTLYPTTCKSKLPLQFFLQMCESKAGTVALFIFQKVMPGYCKNIILYKYFYAFHVVTLHIA